MCVKFGWKMPVVTEIFSKTAQGSFLRDTL